MKLTMAGIQFVKSLFLLLQIPVPVFVILSFNLLLLFVSAPISAQNASEKGSASFYANAFNGHKTASGEKYNKNKLTAAHRTYAFGTILKVTNQKNGNTVTVTVNDRGPYTKNRLIDLSYAAAKELDMIRDGVAQVTIEIVNADADPKSPGKKQPDHLKEGDYYTEDLKPIMRPKGYLVQVGSFSLVENAQARIEELKPHHPGKAYIQIVLIRKKKLYRVLYGPFNNEEEAKNKRTSLKQQGYDCIVISEDK